MLPRMKQRYCKHVVCQTCMQHQQCLSCQRLERHLFYIFFWTISNTTLWVWFKWYQTTSQLVNQAICILLFYTEKGGRQDRMQQKLRYHYQYHHNYLPPPLPSQLSQMKRWGEESREEEPQKTQSHSHSCIFRSRPVILGGILMQDPKFN